MQGQALFPAYDAKRPAPKANMQQQPDLLTVVGTSSTKDQSLVRDMQKVLNAARKAEQKVARIKEDKATKVRMWEEWEVQLKQQYLAESKRHQANIESLDRDLEAALKAQDMARAEVRRAADPESSQDVQMMAPSSEMEVAFARLLDDARSDSWAQLENEEVLKRAMQASRLSGPSTPPTSTPLPRTPYGRVLAPRPKQQGAPQVMGSRLQPFPPPRSAEMRYPAADLNPVPSPVAQMDPYQQPPSGERSGDGQAGESMVNAVMSTLSPPPSATSLAPAPVLQPSPSGRQLKVRQDVKEASRPAGPIRTVQVSPQSARDEKKDAKRAELWAQSMQQVPCPLQIAAEGSHGSGDAVSGHHRDAETGEPPGVVSVQRFSLQDDDGDDEPTEGSNVLEGIMD